MDGRVSTAINALLIITILLCYYILQPKRLQDVHNGNVGVILQSNSVQVKIERAISEVHKYGTLRVDSHGGIQSTLHDIFAYVTKLISQKLSILREEDSP